MESLIEIMLLLMAIFVMLCAIIFPIAYFTSESTQILARKQGIELTRWQAMWVDQKALINNRITIEPAAKP